MVEIFLSGVVYTYESENERRKQLRSMFSHQRTLKELKPEGIFISWHMGFLYTPMRCVFELV